ELWAVAQLALIIQQTVRKHEAEPAPWLKESNAALQDDLLGVDLTAARCNGEVGEGILAQLVLISLFDIGAERRITNEEAELLDWRIQAQQVKQGIEAGAVGLDVGVTVMVQQQVDLQGNRI
ncbi:MAG TPA: hypothetical protein VIX90_11350, partial [Edaphobacter sp.]